MEVSDWFLPDVIFPRRSSPRSGRLTALSAGSNCVSLAVRQAPRCRRSGAYFELFLQAPAHVRINGLFYTEFYGALPDQILQFELFSSNY